MRSLPAACAMLVLGCPPLVADAEAAGDPTTGTGCSERHVAANRHDLWVDLQGTGQPVVVFEAGGANDSSVWAGIAPRIRAMGASTFVYDRAGLGRSAADPSPYSIQRELDALRQALDQCAIGGQVVIVAHSYGGFLALLSAAQDRRVKGLVLLDAIVPGFYTPARTATLLQQYRPQYAEVRAQAPQLARTLIPLMEAYPQTAATLEQAVLPRGLPVIDIVAGHPAETTPEAIAAWKDAHARFVAADAARKAVHATGSGHHIERDQPDLVVDAIAHMLRIVGQEPAGQN